MIKDLTYLLIISYLVVLLAISMPCLLS